MAKHETKTIAARLPIFRSLTEIEPKLLTGLASSVTVGAVVAFAKAVGLNLPTWVALLIVVAVYFVTGYITRSTIPVPADSGLTAKEAALVGAASTVGSELSEEDYRAAAQAAFEAAGMALDDDGTVLDQTHPLVATDDARPHPTE